MERKLATIRIIKDILPIPDSDNIELAVVDGWQSVVKKGEFNIGDKVIYCEVDSVLPEKPEYEFLRKSSWNPRYKGFRLRTIRLRGAISQGLILPLKEDFEFYNEGTDVTEFMEIVKYELPPERGGNSNGRCRARGNFPYFIPKTDEERIQNLKWNSHYYDAYKDNIFYITEKIDGQSSTFYIKDDIFGVCSRNFDLEDDDNNFWNIARKYDIEIKLRNLEKNIAIQGEIYGLKIQDNKYDLKEILLAVYNVYDIDNMKYYDYIDFKNIVGKLGLETVPIINDSFILKKDMREMILMADGNSVINKSIPREGLVIRPVKELWDTRDGRISFKCISNEFLLKFKV